MPAVYLNYIIPPNAKAESLIVSQFQFTRIPGEYYIYPAQPPRVIGESIPWVAPDTLIYNSDNLFPGEFIEIVDEGVMDGARIVTVEVKPLQYRPKTKRLFLVRQIGFEFAFGPNTPPELRPRIRGKYEQAVYDAALQSVVQNKNEIPAYYQRPAIVEENQISGSASYPVGPAIIIAPQEFHSAFQPYADWMTDQGIKTYLITPQTIYTYFHGVDNAEKVRNYIKHCYENAGGTYFILGGDQPLLPVRFCYPADREPGQGYNINYVIATQLYFSDLTGNWNVDGDEWWGEPTDDAADRFPEVFIARITSYNANEVSNWVNKAIRYEKYPSANIDFTTCLWIVHSGVGPGDAWTVFPPHFSHIWATDIYANEVLTFLDRGYGFTNTNTHGNVYRFNPRTNARDLAYMQEEPTPYDAGLNYLSNITCNYLHYSIACFCGAYDDSVIGMGQSPTDTCIADAFVDAYSEKGAIAYLGNTRFGWGAPQFSSKKLETEFYRCIFNPWVGGAPPEPSTNRLGVAEALSKCGASIDWDYYNPATGTYIYRFVAYEHTLFGSPYTEPWTKTPGNMGVSHLRQIYVGQQIQFTVTVRDALDGRRLRYCKVCLNKAGDIYQVGSTDSNGQVTFPITPQSTGTLKVTVTRLHNADNLTYTQYRPSQTTCQVLEPSGGGQSSGSNELLPTTLCIRDLNTISRDNLIINYGVPVYGNVSLYIYDATGSRIRVVTQANLQPGFYKVALDTKALSCGVYFVVLKQNNEKVSKKFLLMK